MQYQRNCTAVGNFEARMSMVPRKWPIGLPLNPYSIPMDDPPDIPGATCNFAMPDQSTRERYLWVRVAPSLQQEVLSPGTRTSSSSLECLPFQGVSRSWRNVCSASHMMLQRKAEFPHAM